MNKIKLTPTWLFVAASIFFTLAALTKIRAQSTTVENNLFSIYDSPDLPRFSNDSTKFSFVSIAAVNVTNTEELYAAVNNFANAGNQIVLAPGVYLLSVNDANGAARPNAGRLEPSNATWIIQRSREGLTEIPFGISSDKLVPADYDGDGKTDIAVFRPQESRWFLRQSSAGFATVDFGLGTDKLAPADYDGDGKTDVAVFRDGVWYLRQLNGGINYAYFGSSGDIPTNQVQ